MSYNDVVQAIADAQTDAQTLEDVITGAPDVQVTARLGRQIWTLSTINSKIDYVRTQADAAVVTINNAASNSQTLLDSKVAELDNAITTAQAAGAGANGWTADLIVYDGKTQTAFNNGIKGLERIADLLAIATPKDKQRLYVKSYHAGLKKGGGWFAFDSASTETANGGTVLAANDGTAGRWLRQLDDNEYITPQMFGAKADGVTDDYQAIVSAINSVSVKGDYALIGANVFFPIATYYLSETINLHKIVRLHGETSPNAHNSTGQSTLIFAKGKNGIVVNRHNSDGQFGSVTSASTNAADGSVIKKLTIRQKDYNDKPTNVMDYNPNNMTMLCRKAKFGIGDAVKVQNDRLDQTTFTGTIAKIENVQIILEPVSPLASTTLDDTFTGQTSGAVGKLKHVGYANMAYVLQAVSGTFQVGETVSTSNGTFKVKSYNYKDELKIITLSNTTGTLNPLDILADANNFGSAIIARARCAIQDCKLYLFPHYGISFATDGNQVGNANCMYVNAVTIEGMGRHGVWSEGGDSNAGTFIGLNLNGNTGYGVKDTSFLGNHYFSCHASMNYQGDYYSSEYNNFSVFLGCYSEGGADFSPFVSQASRFGRNSTVIGGDWGSPRLPSYRDVTPTVLNGNEFNVNNAIYVSGNIAPEGVLSAPFALRNSGGEALALVNGTNYNINNGVGIGFYNALLGEKFKRDNSDTIKTGGISVLWGNDYKRHGVLTIDLLKKPTVLSGFNANVSPQGGGKEAFFEAVVTNGVITDVIMLNSGDKYPSAPTFTGTGEYAGVTITTSIFNGKIISYSITNNNTVTNVTPRTPQRAYNITYDYWQPSVDNNTVFGDSSYRWKQGFINDLRLKPLTSVTPAVNGEMAFELNNDTTLKIKVKGSDGVVRSATLTLA